MTTCLSVKRENREVIWPSVHTGGTERASNAGQTRESPLGNGHLAGNSRALLVKAFYWMQSTRGSRLTSLFLNIRKSYRKTVLSPVLPLVAGRGTAPMKERRKGGGGEHDRAVCRSPPFRNQSVYRLAAPSCTGFPPPWTTNERPWVHCWPYGG